MGERVLNCWESGPWSPDDDCSTTCMLPAGHDGPHEWTRDDEIIIRLADKREQSK